jgi:cytochrome c peroxidase
MPNPFAAPPASVFPIAWLFPTARSSLAACLTLAALTPLSAAAATAAAAPFHASLASPAPARLSPTARANGWLLAQAAAFRARADSLRRVLAADGAADGAASVPDGLRTALAGLRRAYKAIEPAVETLHPECLELFNAAPFDRVDEDETFKIEIEAPQGLQVLEEEVYSPAPRRAAILLSLSQLVGAADQLSGQLRFAPPDDALLWEAAENEVIRVLALGLSGFDTPASANGLAESGAALRSLRAFPTFYRERLEARRPGSFAALDRKLDEAARALESAGDFDSFDRLEYLRRYGNPLHAALSEARAGLGLGRGASLPGVTRADRLQPIPERAVAPKARGLFDPAFLDREFFALDYDGRHREPASRAAAELGRKLFFDPLLSGDNRRACASCHRPEFAYAEPLAKSAGFRVESGKDGPAGDRNAPSLSYAAYQRAQFWDAREPMLEDQIGHVVNGHREFNTTFAAIQAKLRSAPAYAGAFVKAFPGPGGDPVTDGTVASALAQYVRTLAGWNSPFDRYVRGERDTLDPAAKRGFNLFMGKAGCGTCHFPPAFNGTVPPLYRETEAEVLGVPAAEDTLHPAPDPDPGRYRVRPAALWRGAFKTPTVRNAAFTAPYMHNGRFRDLEGVVAFYDAGGGKGLGLRVPNQTLPPDSLRLSATEKAELIAFMKSLGDDPLKLDRPGSLPAVPGKPEWAARPPGGEY